MSSLEKKIENSIIDYLKLIKGLLVFKVNTVGIYDRKAGAHRKLSKHTIAGTADIIGCYRGIFFALEVKTPKTIYSSKTYASKDQKEFLKNVSLSGGFGAVVYSVGDAIGIIDQIKNL